MKKHNYALIGSPLGHSMSPFIHKELFKISGLNADYSLTEISVEELPSRMTELENLSGANVTIPHKTAVIPYLARLDDRAALYGAVNTVAKTKEGLIGYNTDCHGFLRALSAENIRLEKRAVVCGCGGVSRMMAFECVMADCDLTIAVRPSSLPRALSLRDEILNKFPNAHITAEALNDLNGEINILINGTPVGMYPNIDAMPVNEAVLSNTRAVFDAVYNPAETLLLKSAKKFGAKTVGGMPMLVWQAAVAQEIWNGSVFKTDDINRIITLANGEMTRRFRKEA